MSDEEQLGIYNDVNEFEEFSKEDWMPNEEDASDKNVWDDTWDQGEIEENEFTQQLRNDLKAWGYLSES
ncbi:hypothetical protein ACTXT7_009499 [Hymenolepis weldensis]